jgi:hypothetical protein
MNNFGAFVMFCFSAPFRLAHAVRKGWQHVQFLRVATLAAISCECGRSISLVGLWRCSCSFTYRGHLLTICPLCWRLPRIVRCYGCGITTKLPEPYHGTAD